MKEFIHWLPRFLQISGAFCAALSSHNSFAAQPELPADTCILAGRLNSEGQWAPMTSGLQLLNAAGQPIDARTKGAIDSIRAVRVSESAVISTCQDRKPLTASGSGGGSKLPVPAILPAHEPIRVLRASTFPGRSAGQWAELNVSVPADRIVQVTR